MNPRTDQRVRRSSTRSRTCTFQIHHRCAYEGECPCLVRAVHTACWTASREWDGSSAPSQPRPVDVYAVQERRPPALLWRRGVSELSIQRSRVQVRRARQFTSESPRLRGVRPHEGIARRAGECRRHLRPTKSTSWKCACRILRRISWRRRCRFHKAARLLSRMFRLTILVSVARSSDFENRRKEGRDKYLQTGNDS
jgi:hypothetical protein